MLSSWGKSFRLKLPRLSSLARLAVSTAFSRKEALIKSSFSFLSGTACGTFVSSCLSNSSTSFIPIFIPSSVLTTPAYFHAISFNRKERSLSCLSTGDGLGANASDSFGFNGGACWNREFIAAFFPAMVPNTRHSVKAFPPLLFAP